MSRLLKGIGRVSVPCMCDYDVVEGCVALAEAGQPDSENHCCGGGRVGWREW